MAAAPSSPRKNPHSTAANRFTWRDMSYGRPTSNTRQVGVPVRSRPSNSSSCRPGKTRSATSQPSPEVPAPKRPAWSPSTAMHTSAALAASTAAAMSSVVPPRRATLFEGDLVPRRVAAESFQNSRHRDAHRLLGVAADRRGPGTSSSQASRSPGRLVAHEGHVLARAEGEHASVGQHNDRMTGERAGQRPVVRIVRLLIRCSVRAVPVAILIKETKFAFLGQDPPHGAVNKLGLSTWPCCTAASRSSAKQATVGSLTSTPASEFRRPPGWGFCYRVTESGGKI